MLKRILMLALIVSVQQVAFAQKKRSISQIPESKSFYTMRLNDEDAAYFTP